MPITSGLLVSLVCAEGFEPQAASAVNPTATSTVSVKSLLRRGRVLDRVPPETWRRSDELAIMRPLLVEAMAARPPQSIAAWDHAGQVMYVSRHPQYHDGKRSIPGAPQCKRLRVECASWGRRPRIIAKE